MTNINKIYLGATLVFGFLIGHAIFSSNTVKPTSTSEFARTTVMITRMDGKSGGTGVILHSSGNSSEILTNAHVCGVVKNGGLVKSDEKEGTVTSWKVSKVHDLCLITTNVNFNLNTRVASSAPDLYSEATVSGHPLLLPTIVTRGSFSQKQIVQVMTGMKKCDEDDLNSPNAEFCNFFGGIPIIRVYQAQVISATIQPGSSGSAVFNSSGEIAGLVFAGSGDIGYGMIVPQEYVNYFVYTESVYLPDEYPNTVLDFNADSSGESFKTKIIDACKNANLLDDNILNVCNIMRKDLVM